MKNFETQIISWEQIQEQKKENIVFKSTWEFNFKIKWILEWNKYNESDAIRLSSREQLSDIGENSHLTLEQQLWKEFWLWKDKLNKIEIDFRKPLTVADVLDEGEAYWESLSFSNAVNEELYWIAA